MKEIIITSLIGSTAGAVIGNFIIKIYSIESKDQMLVYVFALIGANLANLLRKEWIKTKKGA